MPSIYDSFWKNHFPENQIDGLLNDLRVDNRPKEFNVTYIKEIGERSSWNFTILINESGILKGNAAHLNALAEIVRRHLKSGEELRLRTKLQGDRVILFMYFEMSREFVRETKVAYPNVTSLQLDFDLRKEKENLLKSLLKGSKIPMNELHRVPKKEGVYVLWFEKADKKVCLKVGQAGKRGGKGLKERLEFHRGQNSQNTVLATHMIRDYQSGLQLGFEFRDRKQRRKFLGSHCYFQVLALPNSDTAERKRFERFLEHRLKPRYSAQRRYEREKLDC